MKKHINLINIQKNYLKGIGDYCRRFREKKGIAVCQMAVLCLCSESNIYHFEAGDNNNALILLEYIRQMPDIWLEDLLRGNY